MTLSTSEASSLELKEKRSDLEKGDRLRDLEKLKCSKTQKPKVIGCWLSSEAESELTPRSVSTFALAYLATRTLKFGF